MASSINAGKPTAVAASTSDVRDNFAAAKAEIEELQGLIAALQAAMVAFTAPRHICMVEQLVNINHAGHDVATFTGLPAQWQLRKVSITAASKNLVISPAMLGIYTGHNTAGTVIVAPSTLTALITAKDVSNLGWGHSEIYGNNNKRRTADTLFVNNVVAHGSAAKVSVILELEDWTV